MSRPPNAAWVCPLCDRPITSRNKLGWVLTQTTRLPAPGLRICGPCRERMSREGLTTVSVSGFIEQQLMRDPKRYLREVTRDMLPPGAAPEPVP